MSQSSSCPPSSTISAASLGSHRLPAPSGNLLCRLSSLSGTLELSTWPEEAPALESGGFLLPTTPHPPTVSLTSPFQQGPFCLSPQKAQLQVRKSGSHLCAHSQGVGPQLTQDANLPQVHPTLPTQPLHPQTLQGQKAFPSTCPHSFQCVTMAKPLTLSDHQFLPLYYEGLGPDSRVP